LPPPVRRREMGLYPNREIVCPKLSIRQLFIFVYANIEHKRERQGQNSLI
jgi:hypothetical protein